MSALPANDPHAMGQAALVAMRSMSGMTVDELKRVVATGLGVLVDRAGPYQATEVVVSALKAAKAQRPSHLTMLDIALFVAAKHGVSVAELRAPTSDPDSIMWRVAHPRQEAFYLARQAVTEDGKPRFALTQIGRFFGGRDHTTVLHGCRAHAARIAAVPA